MRRPGDSPAVAVVVMWRELETGVHAAIKEGRQVVAERGGRIVNGELGEREVTVPVVLRPLA